MSRGGRQKDRSQGPERRCIATAQSKPIGQLIRFVVGPEAQIVPDVLGKLPGRGIWVSAERTALDKAVAKGLFKRAAKAQVSVPDGLTDEVEAQLLRRTLDLLSMARKAGRAIAGYEKVKGWLLTEEARVLIQASDGSPRGKTKLRAPGGPETYIGCLTASEIGLAFGREHVIHGALAGGGLTKRVVEEAARLEGLRGSIGRASVGKD